MRNAWDVIVLGTGTAASQIATVCRSAGKTVAVIDSKPFGGTCQLRGCDPKKVLVGAADLVDWANRMKGRGIAGDTRIDWPALMRFKRTFTDPVPRQKEEGYATAGIGMFHGRAQFLGPDRIQVDGRELTAAQIAIATGMRPAALGIPGEELLITSEQFLNLDQLPPRIAFVGGGYIAFEFGHMAARAGAKVTIVDRGSRPLAQFDPDLVDRLIVKTRSLGIEVALNAAVSKVERNAIYASGVRYEADLCVHAAGRVPDVDDLDLGSANVEYGPKGIRVDEYLQSTSNPRVFAAGDCADTGNPALTPVAGYEGRTAAANMLAARSRKQDARVIPSVVFSIPPLARAGFSEEQALRAGLKFESIVRDSSHWYSSRRIAEDCSGSKVLIEQGSGRILGAHLLGEGSEEIVNIFAVSIRAGVTRDDLKTQFFSYPSRGSDIPYMIE